MELITALAEAQKCQEATLSEMRRRLEENQVKLDGIVAERETIEGELSRCHEVISRLELEKSNVKRELNELVIASNCEINDLKHLLALNETEWRKLLDERKDEVQQIEAKLADTETELAAALRKIELITKDKAAYDRGFKKLKLVYSSCRTENDKLKDVNENLEKNLNGLKLDLLKLGNNNDRTVEEIKWTRKQLDTYRELWENLKQDKCILEKRLEQLIQHPDKTNSLDYEFKQLKITMLNLSQNNVTILDSINDIRQSIHRSSQHVATQTEMTSKELNQYEHLDREATLLVVGLREELISAKDELMKAKHDNEDMKLYMYEARRQLDIADEEKRVQRLEQTVDSLTQLVSRGDTVGAGYSVKFNPTNGNDAVLGVLGDIKKDLALLKTRSWNRVVRAEVEEPTRDRSECTVSPRRAQNPPDAFREMKFSSNVLPRK